MKNGEIKRRQVFEHIDKLLYAQRVAYELEQWIAIASIPPEYRSMIETALVNCDKAHTVLTRCDEYKAFVSCLKAISKISLDVRGDGDVWA